MGEHIFFEEELFMLKGKKFFLGMAVLVSASLFILGCETEVEVPYSVRDVIHIDVTEDTVTNLDATLAANVGKTVGYIGTTAALPGLLTVPEDTTLVLFTSLTVASAGIVIEGTVYVEADSVLTADTSKVISVVEGGVLNVGKGTLAILADGNVDNGTASTSALGSDRVVINGGTLKYAASAGFTAAADLAPALRHITKGTLDVSAVTNVATNFLPSAVSSNAAVRGEVSPTRQLVVTADATEDQTTLDIPAGMYLTTDEVLTTVTTLTVNGSLNAGSATFAAVLVTVNGNGSLTAGGTVNADAAKVVIESSLSEVEVGSTTITATTLAIPQNVYRGFTAAAAPSAAVTVGANATLYTDTSFTLAATGTLQLGSGAKITGVGTVVAGATKIVGGTFGWKVVGAGTVTIASLTAATSSITASATSAVLTAQGAGATITQTAAESNNLTIAAGTTINLEGTATVAAGKLILTGDDDNPGALTLADAATSVIQIGASPTLTTPFAAAASIGSKTIVAGTGGTAAVYTALNTNAAGKFLGMKAGTAGAGLKAGATATTATTLDSTQAVS
jgi:hypothetical protein